MFNYHRLRFLGFAFLILIGCAGLTAFDATPRIDATVGAAQATTRSTAIPMLILQRPDNNACATGTTTFSWRWKGSPLVANQAFEVRLWKVGQLDHPSVATPVPAQILRIDLRNAPAVLKYGTGRYLWTVAVVQLDQYGQVGQEAAPRRLYIDLTKPANAPCIVPGSPTNTADVSSTASPRVTRKPPTKTPDVFNPPITATPKPTRKPIGEKCDWCR